MLSKETLLEVLFWAFKTITPWKISYLPDGKENMYIDGWNDCLKEIRKNRKKYLEAISKL